MDRRVSEADPGPHGGRGAPVQRERAAAGAHRHRNRALILDLSSSRDLLLALLPELVLTAWSLVLLLLIAWRHRTAADLRLAGCVTLAALARSEEHTSELQSLAYLVCRLLLEKKKYRTRPYHVLSCRS